MYALGLRSAGSRVNGVGGGLITKQTFNLLLLDGKHVINARFKEHFNMIEKEILKTGL